LRRVATTLGPVADAMSEADRAHWFGCFITRYRSAQVAAAPNRRTSDATLTRTLNAGAVLLRHPWTRMAWTRRGSGATLFVGGQAYPCTRRLARQLCSQRQATFDAAPGDAERGLLLSLINAGHLLLRRQRGN
jgi:50S ribosomal protein L16 3-hydroxylase